MFTDNTAADTAHAGRPTGNRLAPQPLATADELEGTAVLSKTGNKALKGLTTALASAKLLLPNFGNSYWEDLREASFSGLLAKLRDDRLDVAHEQLQDLIVVADGWLQNLGASS